MTIRSDFPALSRMVHGRPVCYLDSAASAQKPQAAIDAMNEVMQTHYANVHRGVYEFGSRTSMAYEKARKTVAAFIHARSEKEIVFTRNATEAINLVAATFGESLKPGDEIILTELEHHANIVPWYMLAQKKGAILRVVPIVEDGSLDMTAYDTLLSEKTKMVAFTHMSNALGTLTDMKTIITKAKAVGAKTLVDGSQGIVHAPVSMQDIDCDFYVFTGHKLYGPTGIGVLYGRYEALLALPPYQGGGEMIETVAFDRVTYKEPPYRFEAGTPPIVEAIGLAAAIDYYRRLPTEAVGASEQKLLQEAEKRLGAFNTVRIHSCAPERAAILSFTVDRVHPHDVATVFDQIGICVRAGHHCAQPLMKKLGVAATVRASFAVYNTIEDIDRLEEGMATVKRLFA